MRMRIWLFVSPRADYGYVFPVFRVMLLCFLAAISVKQIDAMQSSQPMGYSNMLVMVGDLGSLVFSFSTKEMALLRVCRDDYVMKSTPISIPAATGFIKLCSKLRSTLNMTVSHHYNGSSCCRAWIRSVHLLNHLFHSCVCRNVITTTACSCQCHRSEKDLLLLDGD